MAREVEQAADLADAELDQPLRPGSADNPGGIGVFVILWGVFGVGPGKLSTGPVPPFYCPRG